MVGWCRLWTELNFLMTMPLLFSVCSTKILLCSYIYCTVKKHWRWKNFGEFGELQHFAKFVANFHNFHNILYANGLQFAKVFSTKLHTVLIRQTFLPPKFFTVWYLLSLFTMKHLRNLFALSFVTTTYMIWQIWNNSISKIFISIKWLLSITLSL